MDWLVPPDETLDEDRIASSLESLGYEKTAAIWLSELLRHPECFDLPSDARSSDVDSQRETYTSECVEALRICSERKHENNDDLLVHAVQILLGLDEGVHLSVTTPWATDHLLLDDKEKAADALRIKKSWAEALRGCPVDWTAGLRAATKSGVKIAHRFAAVLSSVVPDNFSWTSVLDIKRLHRRHSIDGTVANLIADHQGREEIFNDPGRFEFWLAVFAEIRKHDLLFNTPAFEVTVECARALLKDGDHERRLATLNGVLWACCAFADWAWRSTPKITAAPDFGAAVLGAVLNILEEESYEDLFGKSGSGDAKFAWMTLRHVVARRDPNNTASLLAFSEGTDALSPSKKALLLDVAREALGKVRSALRDADLTEAKDAYRRYQFHIAVDIVNKSGNQWRATKACLLALRELRFPSVGSDLRYWEEHKKDPPPDTWSGIPWLVAEQLRLHRRTSSDERMEEVRTEFATFCLERLKTVKKTEPGGGSGTTVANEDLVERDPFWRGAYVFALRELCANPGGRGHHVLYWLSENDPDEHVRREAAVTYKKMRKNEGLPARTSPLTALFAAFWWLRQAHVRALGGTVNQAEATRTRAKEVRRTT